MIYTPMLPTYVVDGLNTSMYDAACTNMRQHTYVLHSIEYNYRGCESAVAATAAAFCTSSYVVCARLSRSSCQSGQISLLRSFFFFLLYYIPALRTTRHGCTGCNTKVETLYITYKNLYTYFYNC